MPIQTMEVLQMQVRKSTAPPLCFLKLLIYSAEIQKSPPAPVSVDLPPSHCNAAPEIYLDKHSTYLLPETLDSGHYSL